MSSKALVCSNDKLQAALCKQLGYTTKGSVDLRQLAQSLMPVILEMKSREDMVEERAAQIVGRALANLKVEVIGKKGKTELIPAFMKQDQGRYKSIDKVTEKDLQEELDRLEKKRSGVGTKMEAVGELAKQLELPGMDDFEYERDYDSVAERHFLVKAKECGLELTHNKEVGRYRIDFSVVEDGQPTHCNISILGEKWHKNKLPHDFARMRDLIKAGELMIPFTARQVFSDPSKCVSEVKSIFSKWRQSLASA